MRVAADDAATRESCRVQRRARGRRGRRRRRAPGLWQFYACFASALRVFSHRGRRREAAARDRLEGCDARDERGANEGARQRHNVVRWRRSLCPELACSHVSPGARARFAGGRRARNLDQPTALSGHGDRRRGPASVDAQSQRASSPDSASRRAAPAVGRRRPAAFRGRSQRILWPAT